MSPPVFHAFEGPPRICRLFGRGKVFDRDSPEYNKLLPVGDPRRLPGSRAVIWLDIERVGTSCGYSVPFYDYVKDRSVFQSVQSRGAGPSCAVR